MKKYFFLVVSLFPLLSFSQTCEPDLFYADSTGGVYPKPYDSIVNPNGGISEAACIGEYFEFNFTVVTPNTINISGSDVSIEWIRLDSVSGLPLGLDYYCSADDCVYDAGTMGCLLLYGEVDSSVPPGGYNLIIHTTVYISFLGEYSVDFPGLLSSGVYTVYVDNCSDIRDVVNPMVFDIVPNPTNDNLKIELMSFKNSEFRINVLDLNGRVLLRDYSRNNDYLNLDVSILESGLYFIQVFDNKSNMAMKKFIKI